jgi:hypothetical protein
MEKTRGLDVPESPFHRLSSLSRPRLAATRNVPAADRRLWVEDFVTAFQWETMHHLFPLQLVVSADVRPWRARVCRSHYIWLPPDDIQSVDDLTGLDAFDLAIRIFDFGPWRPILGQRFSSNFGPPPFDPVSIGLAWLLVRWRNWTWSTLVTELHSLERGLGYCRRLGIDPHDIPAESTFRETVRLTKEEWFLQCEDSLIRGLMAYGIIPTQSTFPGDPPERGVSIATDCQLVAARSRMRCRYQNPLCFLSPVQRSCAAQTADKKGCGCDTDACIHHCQFVTPRDPEAAYVYYSGSNQPTSSPNASTGDGANTSTRGKHHFGYKSKGFNIVDDRLFTYWPISGPFVSANRNDHLQTIPGFKDLQRRFPDLKIGEVIGDAGEGFDEILRYIHDDLKALRSSFLVVTPKTTIRSPVFDENTTLRAIRSVPMATDFPSTVTTTNGVTTSGSAVSAAFITPRPTSPSTQPMTNIRTPIQTLALRPLPVLIETRNVPWVVSSSLTPHSPMVTFVWLAT